MNFSSLLKYEFDSSKSYLVIGEYSYRDIFLSLKKENPLLDIKYFSYNELFSFLEFKVNDDIIAYLINKIDKNLDYLKAYDLAKILVLIDENSTLNQDNEYVLLKKKMIKEGIIKKDIYAPNILKDKTIIIFEDDEKNNKSLYTLLNKYREYINSNNIIHLSLDKSNIDKVILDINKNKKIKVFRDKNEEYNYIFSYINKLINIDKIDPSKIYLYVKEELPFYLDTYASIYKLKINYSHKRSLLSYPSIYKLMEESFINKKILYKEIEEEIKKVLDNNLGDNFLSKYNLEKIKDFDRAYLILKEIITSLIIKYNDNIKGINLITKPIFKDDIYLFITDLTYNNFFKYYKNDDYLFDNELKKLDLSTSDNKTALNKNLMSNFLLFSNALIFSRVKIHLKDKIYPSPFIKEYGLKEEAIDGNINLDGLYNKESKELVLSRYKDDHNFDKEANIYKDYDYTFKGVDIKKEEYKVKFSKISDFRKCPFKYYLENELLPGEFSKTFYTELGNLAHKILELLGNNKTKDQDLINNIEKIFDDCLNDKKVCELEEYEKFLLKETAFAYLKHAFIKINDYFKKNKFDQIETETDLEYKTELEDKKYTIYGRCDFVGIKKDENSITVIDYKTGDEGIDSDYIKQGLSLQVPMYLIAAKNTYGDSNTTLNGFIQPLLKKYYNDGKNYFENEYLSKALKERNITKSKDKKPINDYLKEAFEAFIKIGNELMNNDFKIEPGKITKSGSSPCEYCDFKDICFNKGKPKIYKFSYDEEE